jgi:hypothetical protein
VPGFFAAGNYLMNLKVGTTAKDIYIHNNITAGSYE